LKSVFQHTPIPNLRVITSGFIPSNPAEALGSTQMKWWLQVLLNLPSVNLILIDTPPTLLLTDSTLLAASIRSSAILVIDSNRTRRSAALKAKAQFEQLDIDIKGVILNKVHPRDENYGYGYGYGYYYESPALPKTHSPNGAKQ
jgi:Mrp family chromosome partitioning ATPase